MILPSKNEENLGWNYGKEIKNVLIYSIIKITMIGTMTKPRKRYHMKIKTARNIWMNYTKMKRRICQSIKGFILIFKAVIWMNRNSC